MADEVVKVVQTKELFVSADNEGKTSEKEKISWKIVGKNVSLLNIPTLQIERSQTTGVDDLNIFGHILGDGPINAGLHLAAPKDDGIAQGS